MSRRSFMNRYAPARQGAIGKPTPHGKFAANRRRQLRRGRQA